MLPLLVGVAELAFFVGRRPATTGGQIQAYGAGFVLAMAGLVIAGPWVTMLVSRVMARRTGRPAVLIAGRRLADNPRGSFRAVSGLIVALFIATASAGVITTIVAYHSDSTGGAAGRDILSEDFGGPDTGVAGPRLGHASPFDTLVRQLKSLQGVNAVTVIHGRPAAATGPDVGPPPGLVACAELAQMPALGRCSPGVAVASIPPGFGSGGIAAGGTHSANGEAVLPPADVSADRLKVLPVQTLYVGTNGSSAAIERARTSLETAFPDLGSPSTLGEISPGASRLLAGWRQLADVAIIASLVIAACSLAVSVASGLVERKRPFSLLRLDRRAARCPAACGRPRSRRPTHRDRRPLGRHRTPRGVPLPQIAAQRIAPAARGALLPDRRRRHHRSPRDHRLDVAAARAHHRT